MSDETILRVAVLYADVSGSTRLYDEFGDDVARADIARCLAILTDAVRGLGGRVVKTIGDEVMCLFTNPAKAAIAASEMQSALREAGRAGAFESGPLRIKIGWHYGAAERRGGDVVGLAPVTAQQIIKLAKADEVLTSGATLDALPKALKAGARFIDRVEAQAWSGDLDVYEVPWDDEAELTTVAATPAAEGVISHGSLALEHAGVRLELDAAHPHARLGRGEDCDLVVAGRYASRHHASIGFRHHRFHLRDDSTNGTVVMPHEGDLVRVHREETTLAGEGEICLGATPAEDPGAVIRYRCR